MGAGVVDVGTLLVVLLVLAVLVAAGVLVVRAVVAHLAAQQERALSRAVEVLRATGAEQAATVRDDGARALDVRNVRVAEQLGELAARLDAVTELVHGTQQRSAERLAGLGEQLAVATRSTGELVAATATLREALSSSPSRGAWGERLADDVLRAAGLVEGVSYRRQQQAGRGRPDVTVLLPGDRVLHMDVKFPLDNYLRHLEATEEADRARYAAAFVRDVDQRVRELTTRAYVDPAGGTLDYVLLFVPNEHVYAFAHEQDAGLVDRALARRVVLCSPLTLFAVLAVVRQAVEAHALEERSGEVLALLGEVRDQWGRFGAQLDRVGRGLATTRTAYDELQGVRRRQLERHLDRIDALAAPGDEAAAGADVGAPAGGGGHAPATRLAAVDDDADIA